MKLSLPASRRARTLLFAGVALVAIVVFFKLRPAPPPALATSPATVGDIENTVVASGSLRPRRW
jgi:multidrug efflux pump subunit AcrA (membrane-fusion protein)